MKKYLTALLVLCMLANSTMAIFAASDESVSETLKNGIPSKYRNFSENITEDLELLGAVGITPSILSVNRIDENGNGVYNMDLGNGKYCKVKAQTSVFGELKLDFYENGIHDELSFRDNGEMILNGSRVTIESEDITSQETGIVPYGYSSQYSKSPMKGKWTEYGLFIKDYTHNSIGLGGSILAGITTGALATIITNALRVTLAISVTVGVLTTLATTMVLIAKEQNVDFKYASYHMYKYARQDNTSYSQHYRYRGLYYAGKNLEYYITEDTFYEYKYLN